MTVTPLALQYSTTRPLNILNLSVLLEHEIIHFNYMAVLTPNFATPFPHFCALQRFIPYLGTEIHEQTSITCPVNTKPDTCDVTAYQQFTGRLAYQFQHHLLAKCQYFIFVPVILQASGTFHYVFHASTLIT